MTANTLTFLQQKEIDAARKAGLSEEHIAICIDNHLNYLQIKEVCRAIRDGVAVSDVKRAAQAHVSSQDMEELFRCLKTGEESLVQIPEQKKHHQFPRTPGILCCVLLLFVLFMFVPWPKTEAAEILTLTADEIELACGELFRPELYIKSGEQDGKLNLPASFHAERPENRIVVYEQQLGRDVNRVMLKIKVVDRTSPVLTLKKNDLKLLKGIRFEPSSMIASAEDNVDESLLNRVTWTDEDPDTWNDRDIVYEVADTSGNKTTAVLHLSYEDTKAEETEETIAPSVTAVPVSPGYEIPVQAPVYEPPVNVQEETVTETIIETTVEQVTGGETVVEHHPG